MFLFIYILPHKRKPYEKYICYGKVGRKKLTACCQSEEHPRTKGTGRNCIYYVKLSPTPFGIRNELTRNTQSFVNNFGSMFGCILERKVHVWLLGESIGGNNFGLGKNLKFLIFILNQPFIQGNVKRTVLRFLFYIKIHTIFVVY